MDAHITRRYRILEGGAAIYCNICHKTSHNITDVDQRYCANCKVYHEDQGASMPATVRGIADELSLLARADIASGSELAPQIFVINTVTQAMWQPAMQMGDVEEREAMAQETRLLADQHDADLVIVLSEAWAQPVDTPADMAALRAQYGDSIAAMPGRLDVLMLSVETDGHYWQGKGPISGAGLDRRCGEVMYELSDDYEGRFTHFLASAADKAALAATLARVEAVLRANGVDPRAMVHHDGRRSRLLGVLRRVLVKNGQYTVDDDRITLAAVFLAQLVK